MFWNRRSLEPTPDKPCEFADCRRSRYPAATAEAITTQHSTSRRPDYRSPTEHVTGDTSATARPSRHETPHQDQPHAGRTATLGLPRRPGSSHSRNRVHPANRMAASESALNNNLTSSGSEHHSPHESPRATRHADVATDMSSRWSTDLTARHPSSTLTSNRGNPSCPWAGSRTWSTPKRRRRPATRSAVRGDDLDPGKPGTPHPYELLQPSSARSATPAQGFWPFAGETSPADEQVGSAKGPFQAAVNPTLAPRRHHRPSTHHKANTSTPAPRCQHGWSTARLEFQGTRAKRRARCGCRDCAANPGPRREADTTIEAPKRPNSSTSVGIEPRRALTIATSPKDERESTSHER
jgi:hypothetical protein